MLVINLISVIGKLVNIVRIAQHKSTNLRQRIGEGCLELLGNEFHHKVGEDVYAQTYESAISPSIGHTPAAFKECDKLVRNEQGKVSWAWRAIR